MKKVFSKRALVAGLLLAAGVAGAKALPAELIMGNGKIWKGSLVGREGDWVQLRPKGSEKIVRLGARTIKEMRFRVNLDMDRYVQMKHNREFDQMLVMLSTALKPFDAYKDIPSNLTRYRLEMMEVYYQMGQYGEALRIASVISADDRNPELQERGRAYQMLSLIADGSVDAASTVVKRYGWDKDVSDAAPPSHLYVLAELAHAGKHDAKAMELNAKVIGFHSQSPEWMQPAELLSAKLYAALGLYDSADEVCREIQMLYPNTPEYDKAKELTFEIDRLRARAESEKGADSAE